MEKKGNMLMQKYEFGRLLGQGNFAKVYHARDTKAAQSVAIKVIDKEKVLKVGLIDQTKREISVMSMLKHPNVIGLYEVMATKTKIYLSMEYAKGGELFNKVARGRLREDVARMYFQQLIGAVDFCHGRGVYHRDLKPENLLLDENGTLKITDFGLSALAESKHQDGLLHTTCGTPAYVAPEVISRRGYDGAKADIWSCGVILYVLLAGHLPFHDSNLMEMYRKISRAEYKYHNSMSPEVRRLLSRILDPNPSSRISTAKIMENPWFKRGLTNKFANTNTKTTDVASPYDAPEWGAPENVSEPKQELGKLVNLNAFDIISLSTGFDLSGMFAEHGLKKEEKFTSNQPALVIISKLEDIAKHLMLKICKKDGGFLRLEPSEKGRNCLLSIDVEIFEITPYFHLVEVKTSGDAFDFQKILRKEIRPALNDIVWAWQGEQHQQLQCC